MSTNHVESPNETDADKAIKAAVQKRLTLEREIHESHATADEKANMNHTLSKLWMFASQAIDSLRTEIARQDYHACPAAQRGEPDKGFCVLSMYHAEPHKHADGTEWR